MSMRMIENNKKKKDFFFKKENEKAQPERNSKVAKNLFQRKRKWRPVFRGGIELAPYNRRRRRCRRRRRSTQKRRR